MNFLPYFIFICLALCSHGIKLHEHMTKEEIESTFNCDHNLVHQVEYEITPLIHEQQDNKGQAVQGTRSAVHFTAFDKNISLYLSPNDDSLLGTNTPLFIAERSFDSSVQPRINYEKIQFPMPSNLRLYHDVKKRAAVSVFTGEDNKAHVYGSIGDDYIIRPIPTRLHKEVLPQYSEFNLPSFSHSSDSVFNDSLFRHPSTNNPFFTNAPESIPHIIIRQKPEKNDALGSLWNHQNPRLSTTQDPWQSYPVTMKLPRRPRAIAEHPDIVYPKLLITVDYDTYVTHGRDVNELSKYMAAFWNAVDLRFREMSQPRVRLNIAGLIVPRTRDSVPYFEIALVNETIRDYDTAKEVGRYFSQEDQFPKDMYDIVVAITHRDIGEFNKTTGLLQNRISGIAYSKGACKVYSGRAVALIKDKGGFSGITTAAHELAHSMGAHHDGRETRNLPGGPCPQSDGYLMSYGIRDRRGVHWSRCSIMQMRTFFTSKQASCMRKKPDVGIPYRKILPGKVLSRDEQCSRTLGVGWYSAKEREYDCVLLYCRQSSPPAVTMMLYKPPAEGSYCGEGAICLDAQCVEDPTVL